MAGPANAPAESCRLRGFAGIDEPANVSTTDAEHVGESLNVEHDERLCRPGAAGVDAGGRNVGTHSEFSIGQRHETNAVSMPILGVSRGHPPPIQIRTWKFFY
jgi:hypothetical protein